MGFRVSDFVLTGVGVQSFRVLKYSIFSGVSGFMISGLWVLHCVKNMQGLFCREFGVTRSSSIRVPVLHNPCTLYANLESPLLWLGCDNFHVGGVYVATQGRP